MDGDWKRTRRGTFSLWPVSSRGIQAGKKTKDWSHRESNTGRSRSIAGLTKPDEPQATVIPLHYRTDTGFQAFAFMTIDLRESQRRHRAKLHVPAVRTSMLAIHAIAIQNSVVIYRKSSVDRRHSIPTIQQISQHNQQTPIHW